MSRSRPPCRRRVLPEYLLRRLETEQRRHMRKVAGCKRASNRRAKSTAIAQSWSRFSRAPAPPPATREIRRSEFVTVPSFSPHVVAGRRHPRMRPFRCRCTPPAAPTSSARRRAPARNARLIGAATARDSCTRSRSSGCRPRERLEHLDGSLARPVRAHAGHPNSAATSARCPGFARSR
jgi:hypothetical protein